MRDTIRPATPDVAPQLVALSAAVGTEPEGWLLSAGGWRTVAEERRYLKALRHYEHAAVFVAESEGGEVVARLSLARDPHPACRHVADLGVMVAAAHRRRGVGRALLEAADGWARGAGISKLELHVFPHNEAAITLYEACGYVREGYRTAHYRRDGGYVDAILMARHLG
ncbi:MAG: GNAT family N-acetyltransferase [Actinobacteria bacterium]|nr:GNAT family N-acetyltransferase [Actinomycetota bacterium]